MDFYVSIEGQKEGPFSIFKVAEMLETGRIDRDSLVWHQGAENWLPLRDVPALQGVAGKRPVNQPPEIPTGEKAEEIIAESRQREKTVASNTGPKNVRPFVRFWARMFDYTLISVIVMLFSDLVPPELEPGESTADFLARVIEQMQSPEGMAHARTQFFALIGWHLVEGMLIHLFGTTPGKFLFGIRVAAPDGTKLSPVKGIGRSYFVYVLGVGFYLFPFILIGMIFSFFRILSAGKCLWDQTMDIEVEYAKLSGVRIMLAISAFFVLIVLQSLKYT